MQFPFHIFALLKQLESVGLSLGRLLEGLISF